VLLKTRVSDQLCTKCWLPCLGPQNPEIRRGLPGSGQGEPSVGKVSNHSGRPSRILAMKPTLGDRPELTVFCQLLKSKGTVKNHHTLREGRH